MPHYTTNRCTVCMNLTSPELLTVKRTSFSPRSEPSKVIRSRTTAWLCQSCIKKDPEWNLPAYKGAPGMTSEALERVRNDEVK